MQIDHPFRAAFDVLVRRAPIEVQLVVTRRCNLSCGYCTEYDGHSAEVPYETLARRIDAIHGLRAVNIALLGGEPLLHSRIDDLVRYAARRAQVSVTTNGFLLDRKAIERLSDAGLANLQVSIDALHADSRRYVQKTLHSLQPKLDRLARYARFEVHVTVVLCKDTVTNFVELLDRLREYPFRVSVNIVHDEKGQAVVSGTPYLEAWDRHFETGRPFSFIEQEYGRRLLLGERPSWTCEAGARFLYVAEDGTVELCSAQRGRIGKDITEYTESDLRAHRGQSKGCERGCSVLCVYRDSLLDNDKRGLARALTRGVRAGAFRVRPRGRLLVEPPGGARRHLPIFFG